MDLEVLPDPFQRIVGIRQGTKTNVQYTIRSRASVPVRIVQVLNSCSCAGVDLPRKELGPGESVVATLRFDSGQYRGSVDASAVLAYRKDGEERPRYLKIALLAEIDPDYAVVPERLQFGRGAPLVQRVTLSPRHISDLQIKKAVCTLRFFSARVLPTDDPNQQHVEVAFLPDEYYPDAGIAELVVSTTSERQPTLRVPLDWSDEEGATSYKAEEKAGAK